MEQHGDRIRRTVRWLVRTIGIKKKPKRNRSESVYIGIFEWIELRQSTSPRTSNDFYTRVEKYFSEINDKQFVKNRLIQKKKHLMGMNDHFRRKRRLSFTKGKIFKQWYKN